jgi:hypothetical protein
MPDKPKKVNSLVIKREKDANRSRAKYYRHLGKPVPEQKKNGGRKRHVVVENRIELEGIKKQAKRVNGLFTDDIFKNILRARDFKERNSGWDVTESKEFFSARFPTMTTFKSQGPKVGPKPLIPDWVALCVYTKLSTEYQAVAMFDTLSLAARLMGKGFAYRNILCALKSTSGGKTNFSGTSGIINADDVCHWRYVKRQT